MAFSQHRCSLVLYLSLGIFLSFGLFLANEAAFSRGAVLYRAEGRIKSHQSSNSKEREARLVGIRSVKAEECDGV